MNLSDIYKEEGYSGLKRLAELTGANPQYLRQCASGWKGKRPSPELAEKLVNADPRLDFKLLLLPNHGGPSPDHDEAA